MENEGTTLFDPGELKSPQHLRIYQPYDDCIRAKLVDREGRPLSKGEQLTEPELVVLKKLLQRLSP